MTFRERIAAYLDRRTADADALAAAHGLTVEAPTRWRRTYSDPRLGALRDARAGGCTHVPVHLDFTTCGRAVPATTRKAAA